MKELFRESSSCSSRSSKKTSLGQFVILFFRFIDSSISRCIICAFAKVFAKVIFARPNVLSGTGGRSIFLRLPDRLMAGQLILVQFVVVRIHLGQRSPRSIAGVFVLFPKLSSGAMLAAFTFFKIFTALVLFRQRNVIQKLPDYTRTITKLFHVIFHY